MALGGIQSRRLGVVRGLVPAWRSMKCVALGAADEEMGKAQQDEQGLGRIMSLKRGLK
jgi:hypothetical protein